MVHPKFSSTVASARTLALALALVGSAFGSATGSTSGSPQEHRPQAPGVANEVHGTASPTEVTPSEWASIHDSISAHRHGFRRVPVVHEAYIKASNTDPDDRFGFSVAASGDTVAVGAWLEDSSATGIDGDQSNNAGSGSGAVYVFVRSGSTWIQQAYLKASNTGLSDAFGMSVALSGDTLVVGAVFEDSGATGVNGDQFNNDAINSGAAYVFVRSGSTWSQQAYLKASNTESEDRFGRSVGVSGDTIVVGAIREDSSATGVDGDGSDNGADRSGAAYVFARSGSTWTQAAYLKASNTEAVDFFGEAVACSDDVVVVGAKNEDSIAAGVDGDGSNNDAKQSGAAYVFVRSGSTWTHSAYLKASNSSLGDFFGYAVAAFGDTVVVGSWLEDSSATGVNGDQLNDDAPNSGAAYVFVRSGSTWTQEAYLKASNTETGDVFGHSLDISGDTIVIGATGEDSSATGVGGDQSDNNASFSGAAYVFARTGSVWAQTSYLKASNTQFHDDFGISVAITGDTVIVGARGEDSGASGINGDQLDNSASLSGAAYIFSGLGSVGSSFCKGAANSTGVPGDLTGSGSTSAAGNDLTLVASALPPLQFGFCLTSTVQGFAMNPGGSDGNLCLGGSIGRYVGSGQIQQADAGGTFSLLLDLTNTPQPTGAVSIGAGETWNFQAWYRDTGAGGATSNLTNGLEVSFTM